MIFSFEALRARHGDCLLLHFGQPGDPRTVLIDGGPQAVYKETLKPRLLKLREELISLGRLDDSRPLPLALAMVSHIDDDHIGGLLALLEDGNGGLEVSTPSWVAPKALWHNTFDKLAGEIAPLRRLTLEQVPGSKTAAVIASVPQGEQLRREAERLRWRINAPFADLVHAPAKGGAPVDLDSNTEIVVLGPRDSEIERMRREWRDQLKKLQQGKTHPAAIAAYLDNSPTNLSSIVCLARQGQHKILLTGDGRGDLILAGLDAAGAMTADKLHVDILKIPHHGSIRDLDADFFQRITADHYVISADGKYDNPDSATLQLIVESRPTDDFSIHLTYAAKEGDLGARLGKFAADRDAAGRQFVISARSDPDLSLAIDLGDLPFGP